MMVNESSYFGPPSSSPPTIWATARAATRRARGADAQRIRGGLLPLVRHPCVACLSVAVVRHDCMPARSQSLQHGARRCITWYAVLAPDLAMTVDLGPMRLRYRGYGIPMTRVVRWPYTRQREGPAFRTEGKLHVRASLAPNFHRGFWYARQLRASCTAHSDSGYRPVPIIRDIRVDVCSCLWIGRRC